jgi:hypothetical protein
MFEEGMDYHTLGFSIKLTQGYKSEFDRGHWTCVVEDAQGNVIWHTESMGSGAGHKMTMDDVFEKLEQFKRRYNDSKEFSERREAI